MQENRQADKHNIFGPYKFFIVNYENEPLTHANKSNKIFNRRGRSMHGPKFLVPVTARKKRNWSDSTWFTI